MLTRQKLVIIIGRGRRQSKHLLIHFVGIDGIDKARKSSTGSDIGQFIEYTYLSHGIYLSEHYSIEYSIVSFPHSQI